MLPFRLVYHPGYDLNLGDHVFPSQKYRLIHDRLLAAGVATAEDFVEPAAATDEDIRLVHEPGWVDRLKNGTLSEMEILKLEVPYSREMVRAVWLAAGGTILASHASPCDHYSLKAPLVIAGRQRSRKGGGLCCCALPPGSEAPVS